MPADRERLPVSPAQLGAAGLTTVSVTLLGSLLGGAGTLAAAVITSVATTAGTALWAHGLRVTGRGVRKVAGRTAPVRSHPRGTNVPSAARMRPEPPPPGAWRLPARPAVLAAAAAALAAITIGTVTGVEAAAGRPVAHILPVPPPSPAGQAPAPASTSGSPSSSPSPAGTAPPSIEPTLTPSVTAPASTAPASTTAPPPAPSPTPTAVVPSTVPGSAGASPSG